MTVASLKQVAGDQQTPSFTGENLIFIVGSPRSGTTWLQRLLASHPAVVTGQETHLFSYVGPLLRSWRKEQRRELDPRSASGRGGVGLSCYLSDQEYLGCVKLFLGSILERVTRGAQPGRLFLEKTPGHALFIPEIRQLLPKSRFIHLIRDPRDVVASMLAAADDWGKGWAPHSGRAATAQWLTHLRAARNAGEDLPSDCYREVRYESLAERPVESLRTLVDFLELDWSTDGISDAVDANTSEAVRRGGGTPIPLAGEVGQRVGAVVVDPPSFVRKGRVGSWRSDLSLAQKLTVWRLAGKTMKTLGYSWRAEDFLPGPFWEPRVKTAS